MTGITLANDACCGYEEHQHTNECLARTDTLLCGFADELQAEPAQPLPEPVPDGQTPPEEQASEADADATAQDALPAELPPQHLHTDECYEWALLCGYEEHIHAIACYSDPKADVEEPDKWQAMFADYPYTGDLRQDLVGIASTQVGYAESTLNFWADDSGVRHGYTRYGAWYGAPYNDWSAMFVSFCLHYAGADPAVYPISSGADNMAGLWAQQEKYAPAGEYTPVSGDLVFFKNNTVGIVVQVQAATFQIIIGDAADAVSTTVLPLNDGSIDGWGVISRPLPEQQPADDAPAEESVKEEAAEAPPEEAPPEDEPPAEDAPAEDALTAQLPTGDELLDISNGPAVFIFEGSAPPRSRRCALSCLKTPGLSPIWSPI